MSSNTLVLCLLLSITAYCQHECNTTTLGSIDTNGYNEFNIDLPQTPSSHYNDTFIRFSTCSTQTTFDTVLYLFNENKTNIIDSCDDSCSSVDGGCQTNSRSNHKTIWDLYLDELSESKYVLQISGYQGETGSYSLTISYDCDTNLSFIAITPSITPTTSSDTIMTDVSSVFDVESNEISETEVDGAINLAAVIVVLSLFCCCFIGFNIWRYKEEEVKGAFDTFMNNPKLGRALKITSQVTISGLSIVGSLALSDSFGLSTYDNGLLAVTMGSMSLILACWKVLFSCGDVKIPDREIEKASVCILNSTIMGTTITDATFDIFQGIAAMRGEEYSSLSAFMLVTATWIGVGEEIIEGIFEIGSIICLDCVEECGEGSILVRWIVDLIMHIGGIVELAMGIYIFSTFAGSIFIGFAIGVQSIFLLIAILWICGTIFIVKENQ